MMNNYNIRSKICFIFESYLYFGLFELVRGVKAQYELTPSVCVFSVTFKTEEFVWVIKFYYHLEKCFEELQVEG